MYDIGSSMHLFTLRIISALATVALWLLCSKLDVLNIKENLQDIAKFKNERNQSAKTKLTVKRGGELFNSILCYAEEQITFLSHA